MCVKTIRHRKNIKAAPKYNYYDGEISIIDHAVNAEHDVVKDLPPQRDKITNRMGAEKKTGEHRKKSDHRKKKSNCRLLFRYGSIG